MSNPNKENYDAHITRLKALGAKILSFNTPCCGKVVETQAPVFPAAWASQENCPHCGKLYLKTSTAREAFATPE